MIYGSFTDLATAGGISSLDPTLPDDLYVVSASYEPRSTALTSALSANYRTNHAIVYVNKDHLGGPAGEKMQAALTQLKTSLAAKTDDVQTVDGSWADPSLQVGALRSAIQGLRKREGSYRISIDITTFNREALIVCLALLRTHLNHPTLQFLYASPSSHGAWLSRGFRKVRSIIGFSGVQQASRPTVLVVLSGFEGDRTIKLIEEYEPSRVMLGFGDPPTLQSFLNRNIDEHRLVLSRTDVEEFRFPAGGIAECAKVLASTVEPLLATSNVVVAPMSTKLSTVAAFIVAEQFREVQLAYCLPGEYNHTDYSQGTDRAFVEVLDLA